MPHPAAAKRPAHYLFVAWDAAGGFAVLLRLARRLLGQGHRVTILGSPALERPSVASRCSFARDTAMAAYAANDIHEDELAWLIEHVWRGPAPALAAEVVTVAQAVEADAVVVDEDLLGGHVGAEASGPQNVRCYGYQSHARLLPHVGTLVTHAGHASVMAALAAGIPMVCVPQGRDQPDNADRVAEMGAGLVCPPDDPRAIRAAITRVLAETRFRDVSRRLSREIAASVAADRAIMELERLVRP